MRAPQIGFAPINGARIYYEVAGEGPAFAMIHAGVADRRQWTSEFAHFQACYRVLRYDLRGYGKSEPVEGEFSHMQDLSALLEHIHWTEPVILMGCSMGGTLALDFALAQPSRVAALIMVAAGPSGLTLDVQPHPKAQEAEKAYNDGDLDLVAELETQIWFDGMGRTASQVDQAMRSLVYDMNRRGLELDARRLGTRLPDASTAAAGRLSELKLPVLVMLGAYDTPYILAAAEVLVAGLPNVRRAVIQQAAHLPNLEQPDEFLQIVSAFLSEVRL